MRDGEAFLQIVTDEGGLHLKLIPAEQVDPSLTRELGVGARIVAGIEYDAADRVVAFHVLREAPGVSLFLCEAGALGREIDRLFLAAPARRHAAKMRHIGPHRRFEVVSVVA